MPAMVKKQGKRGSALYHDTDRHIESGRLLWSCKPVSLLIRRALSGYGSLRASLLIVIRLFSSGGNVLLIFTVNERFMINKLLELLFWNLTYPPSCPRAAQ